MFDLSLPKLLILAVIALVIFGPNELPQIAAQALPRPPRPAHDRRARQERSNEVKRRGATR